jgi:cytochrome c oxidase assembly factor CtaG
MDFRHYKTLKDPVTGNIMIIGSMQDPVNWEFKVILQPEDIGGIMKSVFNLPVIWFIVKNLHQYLIYLWKRKDFCRSEAGIVDKVNAAYDQIMKGQDQTRRQQKYSF